MLDQTAEQLADLQHRIFSLWDAWQPPVTPDHWPRIAQVRQQAVSDLLLRMCAVVDEAWADELPFSKRAKAHQALGVAIRSAVKLLTADGGSAANLSWVGSIPIAFAVVGAQWEPAEASTPLPCLPERHLQAYRWTAAILAGYARNGLEDLHAAYTSDASMPALNRGLRRAALDVLLADEWAAYHLAKWPYRLLCLSDVGLPIYVPRWVL